MQEHASVSNDAAIPRWLVRAFVVCAGTSAGIVLGGWIGWAMDRFPALGLTPESFWHTDPENVWAWCWLVGGGLGFVLAALYLMRSAAKQRSARA